MIRNLRRQFVIAAMISLLVVLTGIMVPVNMASYLNTARVADHILDNLAEGTDDFPEWDNSSGEHMTDIRQLPPETPAAIHYFAVTLDEDRTVLSMDMDRIASVDASMAEGYARMVLIEGHDRGFLGNFRYCAVPRGTQHRIVFLDCARALGNIRVILSVSIGVSILGMAATLCLLWYVSGYIFRPVAESYAKQKQFIADAGHEIKTPLAIISADADLVELECGENEWLEDIRRQTQRLAGMTNELIYLSRMDEGQRSLQMIDFPVSDVVEDEAQQFQAPAIQQNKELTICIMPMLSFCGSERDIRQLVSILLDNALKYSPQNSRIQLQLKISEKKLVLSVVNTTVGDIDKSQLKYLFDRFYRPDASRNSGTGGYGLGLSIARGIVNAHKGNIKAIPVGRREMMIVARFPIR